MTEIIVNGALALIFVACACACIIKIWKRSSDMRDEIREELAKGIDPLFTLSMDDDEVNELKKRNRKVNKDEDE